MAKSKRNSKNPSSLIFWNDLENDEQLKTCSLAAQGLWACRLLPIAARSAVVGVVQIGSHPCRWNDDLPVLMARAVGATPEIVEAIAAGYRSLLSELVNSGAASVDDDGRVYNRRMVREEAERAGKSQAGKAGARARWGKGTDSTPHGRPYGGDHATDDGRERGTPDGTAEAAQQAEKPANSGSCADQAGENGWQPDSSDHGSRNGRPMASSCFSLQASKEEITNTGVVTTAGHAAEAGGHDSTDRPVAGSPPPKPTRDRGTRIPDDWAPTPELEQFARDRGLDPEEVALEFRTYWGSRAGREALKVNWGLAFKNNCIKLSGHLRSSRPQAVAIRREERQGELEQFARGGMAGAESTPPKGIYRR
jgi:hypothetical protein